MRKVLLVALAVLVAAALALPASAGPSGQAGTTATAQPSGQLQSANGEYVVAYADGASAAAARAAIKAAGGTVLKENTRVGVATVKSSQPGLHRRRRQPVRPGRCRPQPSRRQAPQRRRRAPGGRGAPDRGGARRGQELGVQNRDRPPTRSPWPTSSGTCG